MAMVACRDKLSAMFRPAIWVFVIAMSFSGCANRVPKVANAGRGKNRLDVSGVVIYSEKSIPVDGVVSVPGPEAWNTSGGVEFSYARRLYARDETRTVIDIEIPVTIAPRVEWSPDMFDPQTAEYSAIHLIPRLTIERNISDAWSLFVGFGAGASRFSEARNGEPSAVVRLEGTVVVGASLVAA